MNDIIFALLIDALVISHLCQNAGIAYSAVDAADACMLTVGIQYKLRTVGGIPCLPRCSQSRSIRITGTHKGCNRSNKRFAKLLGACLLKGIGIFGIALALIRQEGLEDAMQRTVTHHIFLADNVSSMSKSKAADIHIGLIMRIQNLGRLLAVEEAI